MFGVVSPDPLDLSQMTDVDLHAFYLERRRRERVAAAEGALALAEIDRRRSFEPEGLLSTASFVAHRAGDSHHGAAGRVRLARALTDMPRTAEAFLQGEIDASRVRLLTSAREVEPETFSASEEMLVGHARTLSMRHFRVAVDLWRQAAAPQEAVEQEKAQFQRRRLSISPTFEGMVRVDADLDKVSGEVVITAIRSLTDPANLDSGDDRTAAQRRADALVDICRDYLDHGHSPVSGGERPHISVIVDLEALEGRAGRGCELTETGVITPEAARLLACDAGVCRVITRGTSEILDMGRRTRTVTSAQRRALEIRDGGCVIPGCGRPPRWCDAHHRTPWSLGGRTDLADLALLCRIHHHMVHLGLIRLPALE